jgi:hypothetical protein
MEGLLVGFHNLLVALPTHLRILRGPFLPVLMGEFFILLSVITLVAVCASLFEMFVLLDQFLINQKTFVIYVRLNWRSRARSPFSLTGWYLGKLAKGF